jgi:hypothetical protein
MVQYDLVTDKGCGMIRTGEVVAAGLFLFLASFILLVIVSHILPDSLFYLPIALTFFPFCFGYLFGRIPPEG